MTSFARDVWDGLVSVWEHLREPYVIMALCVLVTVLLAVT